MKLLRYHEDRQRGTPDFPLEYHYLDENHPRYQMPYHWHEEYEILHIQTGMFEMTLDEEVLQLEPGDVAFITAGCLHGGLPQNCTYECVVFDARVLLKCADRCQKHIGGFLHNMAIQSCFRREHPSVQQCILPMFQAVREQYSGWELVTLGCLMRFVGECCRNTDQSQTMHSGTRDNKRILQLKKVFELIESDYAQQLTLEQLSSAVHMTPKYFCRFFKEATHRTPIDYLNYFRVESACYEFASTDKNITEVALDCGFSNSSYFIRLFRKYKGLTPGQYIAAIREKE